MKCRFYFPWKIHLVWTWCYQYTVSESNVKFREDDFPVDPIALEGIVKGYEGNRGEKKTFLETRNEHELVCSAVIYPLAIFKC